MSVPRLKFVCQQCRTEGEGSAVFEYHIAAYSRATGWHLYEQSKLDVELKIFFARHAHGSPTGHEIVLVREEP